MGMGMEKRQRATKFSFELDKWSGNPPTTCYCYYHQPRLHRLLEPPVVVLATKVKQAKRLNRLSVLCIINECSSVCKLAPNMYLNALSFE